MQLTQSLKSCVLAAAVAVSGLAQAATVSTDGSTSMEKVIGMLAEFYHQNHQEVNVTYNPTGSGAGIASVSAGRCDIGLSSRALKTEEQKSLQGKVVAFDGIAMVVNTRNKISSLTTQQLEKMFKGEIKNWKEVGGEDRPIVLIGREAGSGTRDGFESVTHTKDSCKYRQELTSTGDVITTVSNNENAIGYASISAVGKKVKMLKINGVEGTEQTIKDGTYKLQRPFVMVVHKERKLSAQAQDFLNFALSKDAAGLLIKAGVVPSVK